MAYIGKTPTVGNFQKCDAISVVNGQASYTLQVDSVNVSPESPNHCLVSLNGVLQAPTDSYTISGSTITFASNLATGDVIDFVIILGNVLDLGVPSDATVTNAKTNFVSTSSSAGLQIKGDGTTDGTLQLNCSQNSHGIKLKSPSHASAQSYTLTFPTTSPATNKFLKTDSSGNLSFADAGGITEADQWRLASDFSSNNTTINAGWERNDTTGYAKIGTGMSESSGIFTFATTGIYWIHFKANVYNSATSQYLGIGIETTPDNSTYTEVANSYTNAYASNAHSVVATNIFFDVTDTSTHKVRFTTKGNQSGTNTVLSNTSKNITDVTFLRLGDT